MYFSHLSPSQLKKFNPKERYKYLSIVLDRSVVNPPKCPKCGDECVIVHEGDFFSQCTSCQSVNKLYVYKSLVLGGRNEAKSVTK